MQRREASGGALGSALGCDERNGNLEQAAALRLVLHLDPASPPAQDLARRWDELTERTMRGYQAFPELKQAIADNYQQGKFEGFAGAPQAADMAFIEKVKAARQP